MALVPQDGPSPGISGAWRSILWDYYPGGQGGGGLHCVTLKDPYLISDLANQITNICLLAGRVGLFSPIPVIPQGCRYIRNG